MNFVEMPDKGHGNNKANKWYFNDPYPTNMNNLPSEIENDFNWPRGRNHPEIRIVLVGLSRFVYDRHRRPRANFISSSSSSSSSTAAAACTSTIVLHWGRA